MELQEVLNYILYVVLTIIFPVVTTYIVNLIKTKIKESDVVYETTQNELTTTIIKGALNDVMDAVLYVNQTYTDTLKAQGKFDEEAQKIALNTAYEKALILISDSTKAVITEAYGSFEKWLQIKIEASVGSAKK